MILGALEAGGTKFVCGVGSSDSGGILERASFPTTTPEETMARVIGFFRDKSIKGIGVGTFGPIELDRTSAAYGSITSTPKPHWSHFNIVEEIRRNLRVPVGFDTDVNGAALGEAEWGSAKGLDSCLYMTVGTGIGAGAIAEGKLIHGLLHPEMGHILVRRHPEDHYKGFCVYHGDCLEGMAAGPAIEYRWNKKGHELAGEQRVWEFEAFYLAQAIVNMIVILSPKKIILGGGVMKQEQLFPLIRSRVTELLNGYVQKEDILSGIDSYIVPPGLGDNAGLCGALMLGKRAVAAGE